MVEHITGPSLNGSGVSPLVLDVACGPARVSRALAEASRAHVVGLDLTEPMLRQGVDAVAAAGLQERITLLLGRGEQPPFPDASFDALTFTYLLRYVDDPAATLAGWPRVAADRSPSRSAVPTPPWWRRVVDLHARSARCRPVPVVGPGSIGRFLAQHLDSLRNPTSLGRRRVARRGIDDVGARTMSLGGG
jgi:demethylmenaquinone methyltransferase/2-methoxy-6-polyprenyl-1,4-benzoquinol methylase